MLILLDNNNRVWVNGNVAQMVSLEGFWWTVQGFIKNEPLRSWVLTSWILIGKLTFLQSSSLARTCKSVFG